MTTESNDRDIALAVYVTSVERQAIRVAAAHHGTNMSDFIRRVVLDRIEAADRHALVVPAPEAQRAAEPV
jgi:uncharacterized protein (DUF1778 family)